MGAGRVHVGRLFELLVFVDAFFDEDAFERGKVEAFHKFAPADEEFAAQEVSRAVD